MQINQEIKTFILTKLNADSDCEEIMRAFSAAFKEYMKDEVSDGAGEYAQVETQEALDKCADRIAAITIEAFGE